jgi:hypothetical protein
MYRPGSVVSEERFVEANTGVAYMSIACGSEMKVNVLSERLHKYVYWLVDNP